MYRVHVSFFLVHRGLYAELSVGSFFLLASSRLLRVASGHPSTSHVMSAPPRSTLLLAPDFQDQSVEIRCFEVSYDSSPFAEPHPNNTAIAHREERLLHE